MASLYDSASLVMIPSGVKEDKLYSIKPTDGSGDFTFSRGSDIEATRVNSSGLIEKARVNNLRYSNVFDNVNWNKISSSVTGGQTGFDGSSNAWLLTKTGADGNIYQSQSYSGVKTLSFYAKANTSDWVRLRNGGGYVYFDVANGVVGGRISDIDSSITSVGGGWYRIAVAYSGSIGITQLFVADSDGVTNGTSGSVYIQFPQLEEGLVAREYVDAPIGPVVEGLTADLPRLDYSGGASCPSLLLEPSRTNLFPHSEYFGGWQVFRGSLTANSTTSPEGVANAYRYEENADTGQHFVRYQGISMTSGTDYTGSIFAKAGELTSLTLGTNAISLWNPSTTTFNLSTGEVTSGSGTIEPMGNGWYRCIISGECLSTTSSGGLEVSTSFAAGSNGDGLYIYGGQFEAGSYPTSYIPTYGTAAVRGQDESGALTLPDALADNYTIFLELERMTPELVNAADMFSFYGSGSSRIRIMSHNPDYFRLRLYSADGSTSGSLYETSGDFTQGQNYKAAIVYSNGTFKCFANGSLFGTADVVIDASTLYLRQESILKQLLTFPTSLTDAEAIALTTI